MQYGLCGNRFDAWQNATRENTAATYAFECLHIGWHQHELNGIQEFANRHHAIPTMDWNGMWHFQLKSQRFQVPISIANCMQSKCETHKFASIAFELHSIAFCSFQN